MNATKFEATAVLYDAAHNKLMELTSRSGHPAIASERAVSKLLMQWREQHKPLRDFTIEVVIRTTK